MATIISSLLDPITLFMAGGILGGLLYFISRKWGVFLIGAAILQLWLLSLPSVSGLMAHYLERGVMQYSKSYEDYGLGNNSIDFVIIMGGSNASNSKASNIDNLGHDTLRRFIEGLAIANKHQNATIIISGNSGHSNHTKAALIDWGIAEERILLNSEVRNTQHELENIAKILRNGNYVASNLMVVSTATHIARVKVWARHYELFPLYSGVGYEGFITRSPAGNLYAALVMLVPSADSADLSHQVLHELVGILYARMSILYNKYF